MKKQSKKKSKQGESKENNSVQQISNQSEQK